MQGYGSLPQCQGLHLSSMFEMYIVVELSRLYFRSKHELINEPISYRGGSLGVAAMGISGCRVFTAKVIAEGRPGSLLTLTK